jgi:hypothetical protein
VTLGLVLDRRGVAPYPRFRIVIPAEQPARTRIVIRFCLAGCALAAALAVPVCATHVRAAPLPPIVFVSRNPIVAADGARLPGAIPGIGPRDRAAAVGGRLLVREPNGATRVLVDEHAFFDVSDPCVSWDGTRVLFAGLAHPDSSWRIYVVRADGTGLRAVTRSDRNVLLARLGAAAARFTRYDDLDPAWLPDGRIVFSSTRFPAISERGDHLATNLFVVEETGECLNRITTERNGADEPSVDPATGRVVYARWWLNVDRPTNFTRDGLTTIDDLAITDDIANIWQVVSIAPDGHGIKLHAGDPRTRQGSVCYKPTPLPDGRVLTVHGANGSFDPSPEGTGLRLFAPTASVGRFVCGLRPDVVPAGPPVLSEGPPRLALESRPPYATDPAPLPDGRLVLSYAPTAAEDFGLWTCRVDGTGLRPLLDLPGTLELDAAILAPRPPPPILEDQFVSTSAEMPPTEDPSTFLINETIRFDCLNVFTNAPVDAPIPDAPRITRQARIRFFLNFARQNPTGRDPSILYRTADLTPSGAVHEHDIPAEVSMFEQLTDEEGRLLLGPSDRPAHVSGMNFARQGEGTKCVGCHAGHSILEVPKNGDLAAWFNAATSASVTASSAWLPEGAEEPPCPAERVVDRRARNDTLGVAWVAASREGESVTLSWPIPIEVSRLVLYGIRPNRKAGTDIRVKNCRVVLLRDGIIARELADCGPVRPEGTAVDVPPTVIDALRVDLTGVQGRVKGRRIAGLAEVETIARIAQ